MSDIYRSQDGDVLDEICWLYYGRTQGTVERVLTANRGLCEYGPILPAGVLITLPDLAPQDAQPVAFKKPWD